MDDEYINNHAKQRFVLAIDEYPYLTESDPAVGSLFQKGWDEYRKYTPLHLILCGSSIAMGKERFGEIANTTGISKSALTMYLKTLIALHMIEKVVPVTEKMPEKSKISRYRLSDPFFKVWFHYVFPFKSELELDDFQMSTTKFEIFQPHLEAKAYEDICRAWVWEQRTTVFSPQKAGLWWDKNQEIDIVALGRNNSILFGEVKWSKNPVGLDILEALRAKSKNVLWGDREREESFILFSRSGFTKALLDLAKTTPRVILVHGEKKIHPQL